MDSEAQACERDHLHPEDLTVEGVNHYAKGSFPESVIIKRGDREVIYRANISSLLSSN